MAAFTSGQILTPTDLNPIYCHAYQTTTQSVPNATWTAITMNAEFVDTGGYHSTVSNTARFTPLRSGTYRCMGQVAFAGNVTGDRAAQFRKNGLVENHNGYASMRAPSAVGFEGACTATATFTMNGTTDYIELYGIQSSGAALNTAYAAGFITSHWIIERILGS